MSKPLLKRVTYNVWSLKLVDTVYDLPQFNFSEKPNPYKKGESYYLRVVKISIGSPFYEAVLSKNGVSLGY